MSGSQFLRLYREIDRSLPSAQPVDYLYENERKETLAKLPEFRQIFRVKSPVPRPKHHGKLVRHFHETGNDRMRRINRELKDKETQQRKEVHRVMSQSLELQDVIQGMHASAVERRNFPIFLQKKLAFIDAKEELIASPKALTHSKASIVSPKPILTSSTSSHANLSQAIAKQRRRNSVELLLKKQEVDAFNSDRGDGDAISIRTAYLPPLETKTSIYAKPSENYRHVRLYDRTKSEARWSTSERQKLFHLYQEMQLPRPKSHLEIWRAYFREFCQRFQCFHPERTTAEILAKAREMIAKSQMKEKGEAEYWDFLAQLKIIEREQQVPVVGKNVYSR